MTDELARFRPDDRVDLVSGGGDGGALHPAEDHPEPQWHRVLDLDLPSLLPACQ